MWHQQYCLAHHPAISSNIIDATHFSTQPTLAHQAPYPRLHTTDSGTSVKVARHPSKHATHVTHPSTPSTQARIARRFLKLQKKKQKKKIVKRNLIDEALGLL